jgi:hypothetical protein
MAKKAMSLIQKPGPEFEYRVTSRRESVNDTFMTTKELEEYFTEQHNLYGWELVSYTPMMIPGGCTHYIISRRRRS